MRAGGEAAANLDVNAAGHQQPRDRRGHRRAADADPADPRLRQRGRRRCCRWPSAASPSSARSPSCSSSARSPTCRIFAINLTTALGLGLGIDYALLMVSRFREQLADRRRTSARRGRAHGRHGRPYHRVLRRDGRRRARRAAGLPAVLPALLRLRRHRRRGDRRGRPPCVVAPALLAVLGHRVNAGRLPWAEAPVRGPESPLWGRLAARGDAPAGARRAAGDRGAAGRREPAAARHVRHAGRPGVLPPGRTSRQVADAVRTGLRRQHRGARSTW